MLRRTTRKPRGRGARMIQTILIACNASWYLRRMLIQPLYLCWIKLHFVCTAEVHPVLSSANLPARLRASGQPWLTNHAKRNGNYKAFYTILKRKGLWSDPIYLQWKEALGCYFEDIHEVMPIYVVEDVWKQWPKTDGVPYCGLRRSWNTVLHQTCDFLKQISL